MLKHSLREMQHNLKAGNYSATELTTAFLQRIAQFDPQLNSFITVTEKQALGAAAQADQDIANGRAHFLTGIPLVHKDIFCTDGIKTSCGSKMLDNFIAPYDATIVKKLKNAGTILLGKSNMDEFAMGSSNENSYYGPVKNPWDLGAVPGGSSGGSAAAVAAGLCPVATGTDTGGSIRQPAALCGITGLKPTYGRVSRYGMIAFASSLDQGGIFARHADDIAIVLNCMAGFDEKDSTSVDREVPDYTATLNDSIQGLRIGLPREFFNEQLDPSMADCIYSSAKILEQLGVSLVEINLPHTHLAIPAYYVIAPAECSSNLARYDGVRYGYRCENPQNLEDLYKRSRGEGFGAEVKRRILIGTFVLSAGYYEGYYLKAQQIRRLIRNDYLEAFKEVDVILGPTTATPAFKLGEKVGDPVSMYLSDNYTIAVNLAGIPALSMPAGFIDNKPIGVQLIGDYFSEATLLRIAHQYQQHSDWHLQIPATFA